MFSIRFQRPVVLTRHARMRMAERIVSETELLSIIDEGQTRYSDKHRLWAWRLVPGRPDNLICAVLVLEDAVVVKTVMQQGELME